MPSNQTRRPTKPALRPSARSGSENFAIAIMAAGQGARLKSKRAKVLHEIGGKPLLEHVIRAASRVVPAGKIYVIIGHEADAVRAAVAHTGVHFVLQAEQRGTGHAIMCARPSLRAFDYILVLSGDAPLVQHQTMAKLRDFHLQQGASMTILTAVPADPTGYGRVIRKNSRTPDVSAIVEQKSLNKSQLNVPEINSGIYAFTAADLWKHIDRLSTDNAHREFYLTDMAALLVRAKKRVVALQAANEIEVLGANTLAELVALDASLRQQKCAALLASGVTIFRPETCVIDAEVEIGPDTVIEPFVQILGTTKVGQDCRIRSFSIISNSEIADRVHIRPGCIMDEARIGCDAVIGPYSHLRPGSDIGEKAHVGNFVETKKVKLGKGSKANHLTYLGDAEIGEGVNIGAGTITCNYDGVNKHLTRIGSRVFVGSDSTLVAPVTIGEGAYIGAASCITEDVPADSLALGRAKQVVKEGWAKAKRESRAASKK